MENRHADALLVKIREAKDAQDLTNEDIAEMAGINETTISRILSGAGKRPSFDTIVTIAAALHISEDKILYAVLPDEEVTPKVETVVETYANVLKVKDDLIQEKNAQIADKDELIDKLHEDISSSRAQRLKLTSALFIQSLVVIALLAALVAYIVFDIAGGGFGIGGV
jgi:transcriptional regulator with XRE-family HTH domain